MDVDGCSEINRLETFNLKREHSDTPLSFVYCSDINRLIPRVLTASLSLPPYDRIEEKQVKSSYSSFSFTGNASLLLQSDECNTGRHPLLANNLQDGGADSDTNSHCALILEETTPISANHNCTATAASREKSNGNNNYEMREFNRRLLLSNGASPAAGITAGGQSRRT